MNINSLKSPLPLHCNKLINSQNAENQSLVLIQSPNPLDRPTQQQKKSIARIYSEQAWMYFQEKNWHKAIVACKNALDIAPDAVDAYKILGNILQRQGRKAEALGLYAKALVYNPNSAAIYANLGSFYAQQKNWSQALDYFQQAVILDPNLAGVHRSLAQIWEELGDTNQALECFCQAVNLEPEILTAEEYFSFAQELYRQGKTKEASIFYIQGVKLNPQAEPELTQLVTILEELEEWQLAVVYYHQLISLSDPNSDRHNSFTNEKPIKNLLSRSQSQSKNKKPTAQLNQTSNQKVIPSLPPKIFLHPLAKEISNSATSAVDPSQIQLKNLTGDEQSDSAVSWNNLGSVYAQKQQWVKALSCYQKSVQLEPNFAKGYRNLARVYQKLGTSSKASLYWYEAFILEPEQVKVEEYFNLAKNLLEQGQVNKAIACLRRTVERKPSFSKAHLILGKLLESQGKSTEAQKHYAQIGGGS